MGRRDPDSNDRGPQRRAAVRMAVAIAVVAVAIYAWTIVSRL